VEHGVARAVSSRRAAVGLRGKGKGTVWENRYREVVGPWIMTVCRSDYSNPMKKLDARFLIS
jgi:hypothetical protein